MPLVVRVAGVNALLLIAAVAVTIVVLAPRRIASFASTKEVVVLIAALALVALVNLLLLRRVVRPLQALTTLARRVDLANPGSGCPAAQPTSEAGRARADVQRDARPAASPSGARRPVGSWPGRRPSGCGSPRSCTTRSGRS